MKVNILPKLTTRTAIVGSTGSGKSYAAAYILERMAGVRQIEILDTKGDDNLTRLALDTGGAVVQHINELNEYKFTEYPIVIYRPTGEEMGNMEILDEWCQWVYNRGESIYYIDELTMLNGGSTYPKAGFLNLLTRGRSRGCTGLYGTQRPSGVPFIAWTEAQQIMVFRLAWAQDRVKVAQFSHPDLAKPLPFGKGNEHSFWYFKTDSRKPLFIKTIEGGK